MIKKIVFFILICFVLMLAGCSNSDYTEPENRVVASAIGVDYINNEYNLTIEYVKIFENLSEDKYSPKLIKGKGDSINNAVLNVLTKTNKKISFYHTPVIILGQNITPEILNNILNYCVESTEISLSINLIRADNAGQILSVENEDNDLLGYKLTEQIKLLNAKNSALQIINSNNNLLDLPKVVLLGNTIEIINNGEENGK
ncbi:MAG: hypothetical protein IJP26_01550 [Clostridia bacterium]|nr:hypothetical protein [Clostridia bacterium]